MTLNPKSPDLHSAWRTLQLHRCQPSSMLIQSNPSLKCALHYKKGPCVSRRPCVAEHTEKLTHPHTHTTHQDRQGFAGSHPSTSHPDPPNPPNRTAKGRDVWTGPNGANRVAGPGWWAFHPPSGTGRGPHPSGRSCVLESRSSRASKSERKRGASGSDGL